jgi:nucleotide-binding universal stress UspA family protein
MVNIKKILLPVDFPNTSLRVIHQAATLARHFHSEIVMLHVQAVSPAGGVPHDTPERPGWDILAEIIECARKNQDEALGPELDGLTIRRVSVQGGAAQAIVRTAQRENVDLIMMPSRGHTFDQFIRGSAKAEVPNGIECPMWTGAHTEEFPPEKFAIRHILCAVEFNPHDRKTASWAAHMAAEFGARLTLAHVTAAVDFWGPGGAYIDRKWKESLVSDASQHLAELQQAMQTRADVFIGSGDACKVLNQAARQTKADLLVTGCRPYGGRLRTHGYAIICAVPIPVLSV